MLWIRYFFVTRHHEATANSDTIQRQGWTMMRQRWRQFFSITTLVGFVLIAITISATRAQNQNVRRPATDATRGELPPPAPGEVSLPHSRVFIHVGKVGLGHEHAVMAQLRQGTIHLGAAKSAGLLAFDMQSIVADTPDARKYVGLEGETSEATQNQVNTNMRGPDVLDVTQFPTATFIIDSARPLPTKSEQDPPQYELAGKFTLHGVQRPLRIAATVTEVKNGYQHLRSGFKIRQTDYGIKPFSKALGTIGVTDELTIYGDAWLRSEGQEL